MLHTLRYSQYFRCGSVHSSISQNTRVLAREGMGRKGRVGRRQRKVYFKPPEVRSSADLA